MPDISYIKSPRLKKLYSQFLRRKAHYQEHDGTWWRLDKPSNSIVMNYRPLKVARQFHYSKAKHRAFGGGFGDGKTLAICEEGMTLALEYPGSLGMIGCATYPQLRDTTRKTFLDICPPEVISKWNKTENNLWIKNGSQVMFRAMTAISEEDLVKFKNLNLGWFAMDQAESIDVDVFSLLRGRLRQKIGPRRSMIAFNMEGHNWQWKLFVKDVRTGKKNPEDYALFISKSIENPYLPEDYVFELLTDWPEEWVARYVEGSFDVFKGKIFKDFDEKTHCVDEFIIPPSWTVYRSIDWGQLNPFGCLWFALDPQNNIYVYGELYEKGMTVPAQAELIKSCQHNFYKDEKGVIHPRMFSWTTIDPTTNRPDPETGTTLKDMYDMAGVPTTNANNDVNAGIDRIAQLLRAEFPSRTIRIMRNCVNLIDEIGRYQWQQKRTGVAEKPQKIHDHLVDALRYFLMSDPTYYDYSKDAYEDEDTCFMDDVTGY